MSTTAPTLPGERVAADAGRPDGSSRPLLRVSDLAVSLPTGPRQDIQAVRSVSLQVDRGERIGIVGESGSGKSVT